MRPTDWTNRICVGSSLILLLGIISSGIPGNLVANYLSPQPAWVDIETYALHFEPIQMLPIWFGFFMLVGFIGLMSGLHYQSPKETKPLTLLAVGSALIYGALISLNYILQLGVLKPAIMSGRLEGMTFLVFANPHSITMSIEMLGYGFQGVSTWLVAPVFDRTMLGNSVRWLGVGNGILSVAGFVLQALNIPLVIGNPIGVAAFVGWNIVFTGLCVLYVLYFIRKATAR